MPALVEWLSGIEMRAEFLRKYINCGRIAHTFGAKRMRRSLA